MIPALEFPALFGPAVRAAVAAGLLLVLATHAAAEQVPPRRLVVVSLNLLHGGVSSGITGNAGRLDERLEIVTRELRALAPDVVGLQEASTGWGRGNVAQRLADGLGLSYVYAPALFGLTGWEPLDAAIGMLMNFSEGPAILSRFPIVASEVRALPRCRGFFDVRVALRADLATPWGELSAYSTHLSWGACETPALARFVAERSPRLPSLVMGDFNATEDDASIALLREEARLRDAFREAEPELPGPTVWQNPDAPVSTVSRRVDYVFLAPGSELVARPVSGRVFLDSPEPLPDGGFLWASDHYAVAVELELGDAGFDTAAAGPNLHGAGLGTRASDVDDE